eukprot:3981407-Pleurochrysis_carterae.AAC.1
MTGEARAEPSMQVIQTRGSHVLEALTWSNTAIGAAMCRAASRLSGKGARWPAPPLSLRSYAEAAEKPRHTHSDIEGTRLPQSYDVGKPIVMNIHMHSSEHREY